MRRNSDFPDPVVPMSMPCGPAPNSAPSLMSRYMTLPVFSS
ncbi:Uncharacterised protein [Mycobacterium tuberculosis]|uniref:Uncharacterized protein n=1 Tax=Mycobacterium tuberculosis TaxID=1773 RepID=A0A916P8J6_MYCTX|nr:Uncharacterised protein [Mycobacterium tuberculosis]COX09567.1 Uncharacterised protein [Mycobacterium tuberculosis]COY66086.1 Uncharacterised protein [Mycobacterium tuberculosis]COZ80776.1 Uncharacterised protein [Mycobacterium tuberculosis]